MVILKTTLIDFASIARSAVFTVTEKRTFVKFLNSSSNELFWILGELMATLLISLISSQTV